MRIRSYSLLFALGATFSFIGCSSSPQPTGFGSNSNSSNSNGNGDSSSTQSQGNGSSNGSQQSSASGSTNSSGGGNSSSSSTGGGSTSTAGASCNFADGNTPTGSFPFPQAKHGSHCTYTTLPSSVICSAYVAWYDGMTTTSGAGTGQRRVYDLTRMNGNTTSEGMGYGMLMAVYMGDKPAFDAFWAYVSAHLSNGLMSWQIDPSGNPVSPGGNNSATDADEDIAWALLMASKQWGGSYGTAASSMIKAIKSSDITNNLPSQGNFSGATAMYPDYARPDYAASFGTATGDSSWNSIATSEYSNLSSQQNKSTGLIPDTVGGTTFSSEATRAPLHVGIDYCWHGTSSASSLLSPMVSTFMRLAGTTYPGGLQIPLTVSGATVTGTTSPAGDIVGGPAGVAAMMSSSNQAFVNSSYKWLANFVPVASTVGMYGSHGDYFGTSLAVLSMLVMDGDFIDYTAP